MDGIMKAQPQPAEPGLTPLLSAVLQTITLRGRHHGGAAAARPTRPDPLLTAGSTAAVRGPSDNNVTWTGSWRRRRSPPNPA